MALDAQQIVLQGRLYRLAGVQHLLSSDENILIVQSISRLILSIITRVRLAYPILFVQFPKFSQAVRQVLSFIHSDPSACNNLQVLQFIGKPRCCRQSGYQLYTYFRVGTGEHIAGVAIR